MRISLDDWSDQVDLRRPDLATERTSVVIGDVASPDTWDEVAAVCRSLGRLDVLVGDAVRQIPAAYAASKSALVAPARQVSVDYAPVRVNCVLPGPIMTAARQQISEADRARSARTTVLKRFGQPDEVAAAIEFLACDAAAFVTGTTLVVDGGATITREGL